MLGISALDAFLDLARGREEDQFVKRKDRGRGPGKGAEKL